MKSIQPSVPLGDQVSRYNVFRVCIIALILRLLLLIYIAPHIPIKFYANPDAYNYEKIALNLVNHGAYSNKSQEPYTPDVRRPPLYPVFLAGIYASSAASRTAAVVGQILLGSLTVGLTYLFSRALLLSHQIALFAALMLAFEPLTIMYTNMLMSETLFTFFLVAGSLTLAVYFRLHRLVWVILSALMYASAALTRPIGQFLPLALLPLVAFAGYSNQKPASLLRSLVFILVSFTFIFIWVFRNHSVAGIWTLSATGEYNLAYYSARAVLESAEHLNHAKAKSKIDAMIQPQGNPENLPPAELARRESQVATRIFRQYPLVTAAIYLDGVLRMLVNPGLDNICAQLSRAGNVEGCKTFQSKSDSGVMGRLQSKFGEMDNVQLIVAVWSSFFPLAIYTLSAFGGYALIKDRQWFKLFSLVIIIVYLLFLSGGGQATSRFRVPTMPYLSVMAGVGLGLIKDLFAMLRRSLKRDKASRVDHVTA